MSFSRNFTFHVSGSVHYPASKSGGSVHYSDSVDVTVHVDTSAFDSSVRQCDSGVKELRGSVVSAARDLVREKAASAQKIATTLIGGFYRYIAYGIHEKMMELSTRIPMLLQALKSLAAHCVDTRAQMEKDYLNITARYAKIFDDLNVSLKASLVDLDRPVFQVTDAVSAVVTQNVLENGSPQAIMMGVEGPGACNSIAISQLKDRTGEVVRETARNITYNITLGNQIVHMLRRCDVPGEHALCMPVIRMVCNGLDRAEEQEAYAFPRTFPGDRADELQARIGAAAEGVDFEDALAAAEGRAAVERFFRERLSRAVSRYEDPAAGERLSAEVMRLWNSDTK